MKWLWHLTDSPDSLQVPKHLLQHLSSSDSVIMPNLLFIYPHKFITILSSTEEKLICIFSIHLHLRMSLCRGSGAFLCVVCMFCLRGFFFGSLPQPKDMSLWRTDTLVTLRWKLGANVSSNTLFYMWAGHLSTVHLFSAILDDFHNKAQLDTHKYACVIIGSLA